VPAGTDAAKARMLMEKAEKGCLISNSLTAERHLDCEIVEDR
jgi:organic hydroperoxide reductase OsmC/OhrA